MSNQDKHITPWSASDVQKYLKGELSAREMHQLEKAALEDPFLADAIEGLSQRPAAPLAGDLEELKSRLDTRIGKKAKPPIGWMKMAATIVLLLGLGYTAWFILIDKPTARFAKSGIAVTVPATTKSKPQTSGAAESPVPNASLAPSAANATAVASAAKAIPRSQAADSTSIRKATESLSLAYAASPGADKRTGEDAAKLGYKDARVIADSITLSNTRIARLDFTPAPAQANRMAFDSLEFKKQMFQGVTDRDQLAKKGDARAEYKSLPGGWQNQNVVYNGQVLDRNNRPLADAYLQVSGPSNAITTTNALGQFRLNLRPQDTTQQLTVAHLGYLNASLAVNKLNLDDASGNTIFLKESPNTLSEVVVTRQGRSEAFATAPNDDKTEKLDSFWVKVAPITGRLAYLDYLQSAKKTLPVDSTIQGAEVISFGIDRMGTPTDFKIEHSLSPAHDAGVIRLIMEGARWKILRGKNVRAMVHVSFP